MPVCSGSPRQPLQTNLPQQASDRGFTDGSGRPPGPRYYHTESRRSPGRAFAALTEASAPSRALARQSQESLLANLLAVLMFQKEEARLKGDETGLHSCPARQVSRGTREKRRWPLDLMGGQRHRKTQPVIGIEPKLRQAILDAERVLIDEDKPASDALKGEKVRLEYYDNGYPKLPLCLDRRTPHNRPGTLGPLRKNRERRA
jgi:hypothetical protein